jgi:TetR/AcrR family transcriptional regulator, fatty acid metabolism regulator protein
VDQNKDKYHRILNAAVRVFAELGFHQATISQIAREAGVADGTIYLYFKNKKDILSHFFNHTTRQVFERFREAVDQKEFAEDKLRALIQTHLSEFQMYRDLAVVFQREALLARHVNEEDIKAITRMYLDILDEIIRIGQKENTIRKSIPRGLVKRFILGAVNEVINTWVLSDEKQDLTKMADPLVDLCFEGIGTSRVEPAPF